MHKIINNPGRVTKTDYKVVVVVVVVVKKKSKLSQRINNILHKYRIHSSVTGCKCKNIR